VQFAGDIELVCNDVLVLAGILGKVIEFRVPRFRAVEEGIIFAGNGRHRRGLEHAQEIVDRPDRIAGIGKVYTADGKLSKCTVIYNR